MTEFGGFPEMVYHVHYRPGRRMDFCPAYPISFFLKTFLNEYRYTVLMVPWST